MTIGVRPGGSSSSTLTSRSPYTVIAAVRGIGVAVITSTSGTAPPGLLPQRGALLDAEAVLLVDDDHAEAVERHALLDQGVGADDEVDRRRRRARPSTRLRSAPVTRLVSSSTRSGRSANRLSPRVGTAQPVEQPADAGGVLLGEHLGRRHQRALVAALHGGQQRRDGDDRLARADVALQQPVHRVRRGEVGVDLADHPPLGGRQREAQRGVEPAHQLAAGLVADADGVALHRPLAHHEHELHPQQLVERQPAPGLLLVGDRLRQVDVVQRRRRGR